MQTIMNVVEVPWERNDHMSIVEMQWRLRQQHTISMQVPLTTCRAPVAMQTILHCYGDLTVTPVDISESWTTVFVLCILKVCTIARHSMQSQCINWWCQCLAVTMLSIVFGAPHSKFFLDTVGLPWKRSPSVTEV